MSLADTTAFPPETKTESSTNPELIAYLFAAVLVALWGVTIALFGLPGLYLPAVGAVPVIYILLLVITRG